MWNPATDRDPNVVEVYVGYVRRKLDQPGRPSQIETVCNTGYRLVPVGSVRRLARRLLGSVRVR